MTTTNPSPADVAAQIIASMKVSLDVGALVADARTKLGVPAQPDAAASVNITGAQAIVANNLLAKADELKRIADAATSEREEIKQILADYAGDAEVLKVNGAEVFTYKPKTSRVLDQAQIKSMHPDIPGNESYWKDQTQRPRRFR